MTKLKLRGIIAPLENRATREAPDGSGYRYRVHGAQAQRCPYCRILLAVGLSYDDHVFWCKWEKEARHHAKV